MPNAKVISTENLTPTLFLLKLEVEGGLAFKAGQFVILPIPPENAESKPAKGFYSIASEEHEGEIELLVELKEGYVSRWVCGRKPGDLLEIEGPRGKFALNDPQARTQIFLGFRAGLAPLRSMILTLLKSEPAQHLHLYLGAKGQAELLFDAQWRKLAEASPKFHYHPVVQPTADNPFMGKNQDPADELIKKMVHKIGHDIYVAGFNHEVDPMLAKLAAAGFEKEFTRAEKFG